MRLPNFLIIGANRAGTTSFYHYLGQHPDVHTSPVKEPMFFLLMDGSPVSRYVAAPHAGALAASSWDEYLRLFAAAGAATSVGEASTLYLANPEVARRAARLPGLRILAILRHPVDRAFSNYVMHRQWSVEPLATFEEAVAAEPQRVAAGWSQAWHYLELGRYARPLASYLDAFGNDRIRVYLFEELSRDPIGILRDAFAFLGVDPSFTPDVGSRHNVGQALPSQRAWRLLHGRVGWAAKAAAPTWWRRVRDKLERPLTLAPATRAALIPTYRQDVRDLEALLGRDLGAWLA